MDRDQMTFSNPDAIRIQLRNTITVSYRTTLDLRAIAVRVLEGPFLSWSRDADGDCGGEAARRVSLVWATNLSQALPRDRVSHSHGGEAATRGGRERGTGQARRRARGSRHPQQGGPHVVRAHRPEDEGAARQGQGGAGRVRQAAP